MEVVENVFTLTVRVLTQTAEFLMLVFVHAQVWAKGTISRPN